MHFVGCFAARVTLYSQQVRALNLMHELVEGGELPKGETVAIIGAGAAGITAATALALARPDVSIDIIEARPHILELQRRSTSRYLRPHIYDWPAAAASNDDASLPILNWTAGTAKKVAGKIGSGFNRLKRGNSRVKLLSQNEVKSVNAGASFFDLTVENLETNRTQIRTYRWILVCIGFGLERQLGETNHSYWDPSILTGLITKTRKPLIFVSGNGDGGLIDFAMATFDGLDHKLIEDLIINCKQIEEAKSILLQIEDEAKKRYAAGSEPVDLYEAYLERIFPPNDLIEQIRAKLRKNVRIVFHTRERHLFTLKSSILNRFIVFLISRAVDQDGRIRMIWGKHLAGDPLKGRVIRIEGEGPFRVNYRFLRFGPAREEVRKPFKGFFKESQVEDIDVPTLLPAAKERFSKSIGARRAKKAVTKEPTPSRVSTVQIERSAHGGRDEEARQVSGRWWIYGLVGLRTTERLFSAGCFRLDRGRRGDVRIESGSVYRIDPNSGQIIEQRGTWESESFRLQSDRMKFFYHMSRPTSMPKSERNLPSQYDSVMELSKRLATPLAGDEYWDGWFEDLGARRGVWGQILAERLSETVVSFPIAYDIMRKNGRTLINVLSKSMWPESA
jgi:hypothetical protein